MQFALQKWDFISAATLAVLGAYFLRNDVVKDITTELITFFSIQSAVILPAMIFTAGILKSDGLELADVRRYHKALETQMLFWVVLLGLDFAAIMVLIMGKALTWSLSVPLPASLGHVDLGWLLPAVLYFSGSLAVFRTIPFVRGVLSLFHLNRDMAEKSIIRRNRLESDKEAKTHSTPMALPKGYGRVLDGTDEL